MAVSNAAVTTTLAPAAAGLSSLLIGALESKVKTGKAMYGVEAMGNGALAGLAAITASCNVVYPWAAIAIGSVAGLIYTYASKLSIAMRLDDPLDAVAVHAWNGMWGVVAAGLFSSKKLVERRTGRARPRRPSSAGMAPSWAAAAPSWPPSWPTWPGWRSGSSATWRPSGSS